MGIAWRLARRELPRTAPPAEVVLVYMHDKSFKELGQLSTPNWDRKRGKFRSFLLVALNHFLSNQRDHERALKRGGGQALISLNETDAENRFFHEPVSDLSPEKFSSAIGFSLCSTRYSRGRERNTLRPAAPRSSKS